MSVDDKYMDALPPGHRIREYEIRRVLGAGGFGITYLAHDTSLDREVAIKEYLPRDYAVRTENHSVRPRSSETSEDYAWGLQRFLDEARTLARLDHPSVVRVHICFEAHGTAYIVMEFIDGETLDERLKRRGKLNEAELTAVLSPLVEGLEQVHGAGFLHRDITPRNILLKEDGTPVLIDFGSARQMVGARSQTVTAVVTPGYAPLEQYSTRGRQGPSTDIYGLSAVAYRCITGTIPLDATERVQGEDLVPASKAARRRYSEGLLDAIDQGLSLKAGERPQDLRAWRALLVKTQGGESETKKKTKSDNRRRTTSETAVIKPEDRAAPGRSPAEPASAAAQFDLGVMYASGRGVARDEAEAVKWYRMAAEQGHGSAQYNLGVMYTSARGVTRDDAEAAKWYRMAAEQGSDSAEYNLGLMYARGRGVPQDSAEVAKYCRIAAEQGDDTASRRLARMYAKGEGVPQDYMAAMGWYWIRVWMFCDQFPGGPMPTRRIVVFYTVLLAMLWAVWNGVQSGWERFMGDWFLLLLMVAWVALALGIILPIVFSVMWGIKPVARFFLDRRSLGRV